MLFSIVSPFCTLQKAWSQWTILYSEHYYAGIVFVCVTERERERENRNLKHLPSCLASIEVYIVDRERERESQHEF